MSVRPRTTPGYAVWLRITTGAATRAEVLGAWLDGVITLRQIKDGRARCRALRRFKHARSDAERAGAARALRALYPLGHGDD
jgi:hypothetical protein